jgi:VanZ family protein
MALDRVALRYFPVWLSIGWLLIAAVIYLSLASSGVPTVARHSDKAGHLLAYLVLTLWFSQLYNKRAGMGWAIAFVGMGVLLEWLQVLTPSRFFDVADMAANATGVLSGWALGAIIEKNFLVRFELWLNSNRA